jgi:hypothetical protein
MPAVVYGKAFVIGGDQRLFDVVSDIEAIELMPNVYIQNIHDVMLWCLRNLTGTDLSDAFDIINTAYGSTYDPANPYLGPLT